MEAHSPHSLAHIPYFRWAGWFLFLILPLNVLPAQNCPCGATVPTYTVDLSGSPVDSVIFTNLSRNGLCCGLTGATKCIRFIVILHPNTSILEFDYLGAPASNYMINCTEPHPIRDPVCVEGLDTFCITYCKPGGNVGDYKIKGSYQVQASQDLTVASGCSAEISVSGLNESSIVWNSVFPGSPGDFNSYLDCTTACDTIHITPQTGYPPYIDIEVTGTQESICNTLNTHDTVRVYFVDTRTVQITPADPSICFDETNVTLLANVNGGAAPYSYRWNTSATTPSITVSTPGTYTVEVTDSTACPPVYDTVLVTQFHSLIAAQAGSDTTLCSSSPAFSLQGSIEEASGAYWWNGQGIFTPDSANLNAVYTPSASELITGKVTLKLTTTGNGSCLAQTDSITLTYVPPPSVSISGNYELCENTTLQVPAGNVMVSNYTALLWTTNGSGSFNGAETTSPEYLPSVADVAAGSVQLVLHAFGEGGCSPATDSLELTFQKQTTVTAGNDISSCVSIPSVNLPGAISGGTTTGIWSSSGDGSFSPDPTQLLASYLPGSTDTSIRTVTLKLTATATGACPVSADSLVLTLTDNPYAFAGEDTAYCIQSGAAIQLNGVVANSNSFSWSSNGDGSFSNAGVVSPDYTPGPNDLSNGQVILRLSTAGNGSCQETFSSFLMRIQQPPAVSVPSDRTVCANNATTALSATVTGTSLLQWVGNGTGVFAPDAFTLNPLYYPSSADTARGYVNLVLSARNNCATSTDTLILHFTPAPVVHAGSDLAICYDGTPLALHGFVSAAAGGGTWNTTGSGSFSPNPSTLTARYTPSATDTAQGQIQLVLRSTLNGNCLAVTDTLSIRFLQAALVSISGDTLACFGSPIVAEASIQGGSGSGLWTLSQGNGSFSPNNTANPVTYLTHPNDALLGQIRIQYTSIETGNCAPASALHEVQLKNIPTVDAGSNRILCSNNAQLNLSGSATLATAFRWISSGSGNFVPDANRLTTTYNPSNADTAAGQVSLKLTALDGCRPISDSLSLTLLPAPRSEAGNTLYICSGATTTSVAGEVSSNVSGGLWSSDGDGVFTHPSQLQTEYLLGPADRLRDTLLLRLTTTGNGLCNPVRDSVYVVKTSIPSVSIDPAIPVCANDTAHLRVTISNGTPAGQWFTRGDGTFIPVPSAVLADYRPGHNDELSGSVWLVFTTTESCVTVSDSIQLVVLPAPVAYAGWDQSHCITTVSITLHGTASAWALPVAWHTNGSGSFLPASNLLSTAYHLSAADRLRDSLFLEMQTTNNGSCPPARDTCWIYIEHPPTPDAGSNTIICRGDSAFLTGTSSGGNGNTTWSTLGDGRFLFPTSQLLNTYIPGMADQTNGSVKLLLKAWSSYCSSVTDSVRISFKPAHVALAGSDTAMCNSETGIGLSGNQLNATGVLWIGSGSFTPSSTATEVTYTPTATERLLGSARIILKTTSNDGCTPDRDTLTIAIEKLPAIDAGEDLYLCKGTLQTSLQGWVSGTVTGGYWSTSGSGSFIPDSAQLQTVYNLSSADTAAGEVRLILHSDPPLVCNQVQDTVMIYLTEIPTLSAGMDDTLCANQAALSIRGTVHPATTRISWSTLQGDGTFLPSADSIQTSFLPGNMDIASGQAHLILSATHSCLPIRDTLHLRITPAPVISLADTLNFCENTPWIPLHSSISGGASRGIWTTTGDGVFDDPASLNTLYHPGSGDVGNRRVQLFLTTTDHGNCLPETDSMIVRFSSKPNAVLSSPDSVCPNVPVSLSSLSTGSDGPLGYLWYVDTRSYTDSSVQHIFSVPGWNSLTLVTTNSLGCSDTVVRPVYVSAGPHSQFEVSNNCSGDTLSFLNLSASDVGWQWFIPNHAVITRELPDPIVMDTAGIYPVRLVVSNTLGCTDTSMFNHTVYPTPKCGFSYTRACQQTDMLFTDTSAAGNDTLRSWWWDFGDGSNSSDPNPLHRYETDAAVTVSLQVATDHCQNEHTEWIPLTPAILLSATDTQGCAPLTVQLSTNQDTHSLFDWDLGNGNHSSVASPQISYLNPTSEVLTYPATVRVTNPAGCTFCDTLDLFVYPIPDADFSLSPPVICPGDSIQLTLLSRVAQHRWKLDNNWLSSTDSSWYLILDNPGTSLRNYNLKLITSNAWNCRDSSQLSAAVYPNPTFTISATHDSICNEQSVRYSASRAGISYIWDYGDGIVEPAGQTTSHFYQVAAASDTSLHVHVQFTDGNSCNQEASTTLAIIPAPIPGFTISALQGCSPFTPTLNATSPNSNRVSWEFGDASPPQSGNSVSHTYWNTTTSLGSYLVTETVTNTFGCSAQAEEALYVFNQPEAQFTCDTVGCSPLNVVFRNQSTGSVRQTWYFGDGNISTQRNPTHSYLNFGDTILRYEARVITQSAFGCRDTSASATLQILPPPTAYFQVSHTGGCTPIAIRATIQNQLPSDQWIWKPSLYSTRQVSNTRQMTHTYSNTANTLQSDQLWLVVTNAYQCTDSTYEMIEVYPAIQSHFVLSDTAGCNPLTIGVTNSTSDSASYSWDFGDGNTSTQQAPGHTYYNLGNTDRLFRLRQIAYSPQLCSDTTWQNIWVYPSPQAGFSSDRSSGCSPARFHLSDSSLGAQRYYLETGDGRILDEPTLPGQIEYNISGQTAASFNLRLTVYSSHHCTDTVTQNMIIYPGVSAGFQHTPSGCSPLEVTFTNTSDQVLQYDWFFGDGSVSGLRNPVHAYLNETGFDLTLPVQLIVTSHFGCRDTSLSSITLFATPDPDFEVEPSYQVFPDATVHLNNTTLGSWNYQWNFGDQTSSTDLQPGSHTYARQGEYIILLTAFNANCSDTISHPIRIVLGMPSADYDSSFAGCAPLTVTFINRSINAEYYQWYFGDGGSSDNENPTYTYLFPGTFTVELIARSRNGEDVASDHRVEVYPLPKSFFQYAPHEINAGEEVTFYNYSDNAESFLWEFGDSQSTREFEPVHTYNQPGTYELSLIAQSDQGCLDTFRIQDALLVTPGCIMRFPNAFTPIRDPAADGYFPQDKIERDNNIFHPLFRNIDQYTLEIYNRWGERIFISEDPEYGWTGYYHNEPAPEGVYVYKAIATCKNGERISRNGTLTLIW